MLKVVEIKVNFKDLVYASFISNLLNVINSRNIVDIEVSSDIVTFKCEALSYEDDAKSMFALSDEFIDKKAAISEIVNDYNVKNHYSSDIIFNNNTLVDYYIENNITFDKENISLTPNGGVIIFNTDESIVLLDDAFRLELVNIDDNNVSIKRTNNKTDEYNNNIISATLHFPKTAHYNDITNIFSKYSDDVDVNLYHISLVFYNSELYKIEESDDEILLSFNFIKSDEKTDCYNMLISIVVDYFNRESQLNKIKDSISIIESELFSNDVHNEDFENEDYYNEINILGKVNKSVASIDVMIESISYGLFDEYAKKYNIIAWDLSTPSLLTIKYINGITPQETIDKFHNMMCSFEPAWKNLLDYNNDINISAMKNILTSFSDVINIDPVNELINKVKKHNTFVRECKAKMRSTLLDLEKECESFSDEIDLQIDWDELTAFAIKRERILHSINGVNYGDKGLIVYKVVTDSEADTFYIPKHILTNDMIEKYELDDEVLSINTDIYFPFYQIKINGSYLLVEKTDL